MSGTLTPNNNPPHPTLILSKILDTPIARRVPRNNDWRLCVRFRIERLVSEAAVWRPPAADALP